MDLNCASDLTPRPLDVTANRPSSPRPSATSPLFLHFSFDLTVTWDLQTVRPAERFDIFIESDACQPGHAVRQVNLRREQKDWIF